MQQASRGGALRLVIGQDGKLQPLWRALAFWLAGTFLLFPFVLDPPTRWIATRLQIATGFTWQNVFLYELELLVGAAILTGVLARYEGRRIDDYGLPLRQAFG